MSHLRDSGHQTTSLYRLLDRQGQVVDVQNLPTDGEALAWAEDLRRHQVPRVWIRRVESKAGDDWVFVSPSGE